MSLYFRRSAALATPILALFLIPTKGEGRALEADALFGLAEAGSCTYFDGSGREAFTLPCQAAGEFNGGLAPVQFPDGRWGYVDRSGKTAIPPEYDEADSFSNGLARVRKSGLNGYIDREGNVVLPFKYSRSGRYSGGLIWFQCDSGIYNSAYMDRNGKQVLPCKYQEADDFGPDGLARARMWDLYGFIDAKGTAVLNFAYKLAGRFDGGLAWVLRDEGFYYIDRTGKRLLRVQPFDLPGNFSEGIAAVRSSTALRWGYMDRAGKLLIPAHFFEAKEFRNGLALVRGPRRYSDPASPGADSAKDEDLRWFYIDREGRRLFPR